MNTNGTLILRVLVLAVMLGVCGCEGLRGYRRTYTVNYETPEGQRVGVGVTLDPVRRSGK